MDASFCVHRKGKPSRAPRKPEDRSPRPSRSASSATAKGNDRRKPVSPFPGREEPARGASEQKRQGGSTASRGAVSTHCLPHCQHCLAQTIQQRQGGNTMTIRCRDRKSYNLGNIKLNSAPRFDPRNHDTKPQRTIEQLRKSQANNQQPIH